MLWIYSFVGVSHFAMYRKKSASDCMRNANKSPILQRWRKWKSDPECTGRSESTQRLITSTGSPLPMPPRLPCLVDVRFRIREELSWSQTGRMTDHITQRPKTKYLASSCRRVKVNTLQAHNEHMISCITIQIIQYTSSSLIYLLQHELTDKTCWNLLILYNM